MPVDADAAARHPICRFTIDNTTPDRTDDGLPHGNTPLAFSSPTVRPVTTMATAETEKHPRSNSLFNSISQLTMMNIFARLLGSSRQSNAVDQAFSEAHVPGQSEFYDMQPDFMDSPVLPQQECNAMANPHQIPHEPDGIKMLIDRAHEKNGYEDGFTTASSRLRENKVQEIRVEMEGLLREYDLDLQSFTSRHKKDIQRMDPETDFDVILDVQELIDEAERRRQFIDSEIVRMNIQEGRIANAINAYKRGFSQGLRDRYAAGQNAEFQENNQQ